MDALTTYKLFTANADNTLTRISENPQNSRDVEYYLENIGSVKSAEELVEDTRLLKFALSAYGLEEMSYAKALFVKLLDEGTTETTALANQLTDPRYKEFAEDFNFIEFGSATTSFDKVQQELVDKFYQQEIEKQAGNDNVGARLAIYFERKVGEIESPLDVLADRALTQVFQTALGLPSQMSLASIERQEEILSDRLDFEDLSDPEFVENFVNRFLSLWDINNPSSTAVSPLITSATGSSQAVSFNLLTSIQNINSRG
ncbi:MAG: DUF1217 domain-containing protein [Pseudomonadota bacterium]